MKTIEEQKTSQIASTEVSQIVYPGENRFIPFCEWAEANFFQPDTVVRYGRDWDFTHGKLIKLEEVQRRICEHVLTLKEDGTFPYEVVVYSTIKKEGKTTLAGAVGAWFSACIDPPNLILTLANDQEQSAGRIFGAITPTLNGLGCKVPTAVSAKPEVRLPNGTVVQAIANNYAGAAGANYGLTLWSELWAYTSERSRRLFDELVPVATKLRSLQWIETYVGFEDESDLMLEIFKRIFTDTDEKELQPGVEVIPELADITSDGKPCCYRHIESGTFYYHNHTPRASWNIGEIGEAYRRRKRATLRPAQYRRLFENRWQQAEGNFIDPVEFDEACNLSGISLEPMVLAGDASMRNDTVFIVGVKKYTRILWGAPQERYAMLYLNVWDPKLYGMKQNKALGTKKGDMDLETTIAKDVKLLHSRGLMIGPFWYDPFQLHQVAINLRKLQVPCVEFGQQTERQLADTFLGEVFRKGELDLFYNPTLETHVKSAKVKEYENQQVRIVKGTIGKGNKVDGAVALSMAVWKASQLKKQIERKVSSSSRTLR